jgi:type II secretory pathway pseudopilin PulG
MNRTSPIRTRFAATSLAATSPARLCSRDAERGNTKGNTKGNTRGNTVENTGGRSAGLKCTGNPSEQGYTLLIAIFFLALLTLSLAVAAPIVTKSIQRDRDLETYHRGMQYRRAVQLYYRKFHAYPPSVDALVQTNQIRFLRKKYIDPSTGKVDWQPVMFGQNKVPTAMGFFGQPLAGGATSLAGIGPSGGNGLQQQGASAFGGSGSAFGGSSSAFGSASSGSSGSIFGSSDSGSTSSSGSTDASSGSSSTGTSSGGSASTGTGSGSGSISGSSSSGSSGPTFGGAGIIGFSPASSKQSILVYKKKNHYNEWEFTYDPISDMQMMGGGNAGAIGQPAGSTTNPVGSSPFSSPGFGSPQQNMPQQQSPQQNAPQPNTSQ